MSRRPLPGELERVAVLDSARYQWEEGARRLAGETGDRLRYRQLCDLVDAVVDELRRRVGQHFTLAQLAALGAEAGDWVREIVRENLPPQARVGVEDVTLVQDAAFHAYARGAADYRP